jgi:hypothetical protein
MLLLAFLWPLLKKGQRKTLLVDFFSPFFTRAQGFYPARWRGARAARAGVRATRAGCRG